MSKEMPSSSFEKKPKTLAEDLSEPYLKSWSERLTDANKQLEMGVKNVNEKGSHIKDLTPKELFLRNLLNQMADLFDQSSVTPVSNKDIQSMMKVFEEQDQDPETIASIKMLIRHALKELQAADESKKSTYPSERDRLLGILDISKKAIEHRSMANR